MNRAMVVRSPHFRTFVTTCLLWGALAGCAAEDDATTASSETSETGESGSDSGSETTTVDEGPWDSLDERPCPPESTVDAQNFGIPFLLTHCNGCHGGAVTGDERQGAPPEVTFDNMDQVRMQLDRIWERSGDDNNTMPPAGGPTEEERALLGEWLACGGPYLAGE